MEISVNLHNCLDFETFIALDENYGDPMQFSLEMFTNWNIISSPSITVEHRQDRTQ